MTEIEKLRAKNSCMQNLREASRLCGLAIEHVDKLISENESRIAQLEAEAADPWREARNAVSRWTNTRPTDEAVSVVRYVRHLESVIAAKDAKIAELEARKACGWSGDDSHDLPVEDPPIGGMIENWEIAEIVDNECCIISREGSVSPFWVPVEFLQCVGVCFDLPRGYDQK